MTIETDPPKTQRRIHGLDAYRGVLMMLGIVIRVGMIFPLNGVAGPTIRHLGIACRGLEHPLRPHFPHASFLRIGGFFAALLVGNATVSVGCFRIATNESSYPF